MRLRSHTNVNATQRPGFPSRFISFAGIARQKNGVPGVLPPSMYMSPVSCARFEPTRCARCSEPLPPGVLPIYQHTCNGMIMYMYMMSNASIMAAAIAVYGSRALSIDLNRRLILSILKATRPYDPEPIDRWHFTV